MDEREILFDGLYNRRRMTVDQVRETLGIHGDAVICEDFLETNKNLIAFV